MIKVFNPTPTSKERSLKRESLTHALSGGAMCHPEHASRARVAIFRLLLALQVMLFSLAAPWLARSHDQPPPQVSKNAERRQVRIPIEDFTLTDQASRPFQFASLRGKVVIVAFAYTTCPDVCPLVTAAMRQVQESLSAQERLTSFLITITTDPEIDTPQVMASYAQRYRIDQGNWVFLTGEEAALARVWKNFGVTVRKKARGLIDHTTLTAVIDRDGIMRFAYVGPVLEAQAMQQDVRKLLRRQ
jgi:protein SCO1/2